jgi:hypothetical protein
MVFVPGNLEALADSPVALACVAACKTLKAVLAPTAVAAEMNEVDKKVGAYLSGVAWALSDEGNQVLPYRDLSGPTGKGFYWVAHHAMDTRKLGAMWAKGNTWHLTRGISGKAWLKNPTSELSAVIALLSKAASTLQLTANWKSWARKSDSYLGHELKKSLPTKGTDLITANEKIYLHAKHAQAITAYEQCIAFIDHLSYDTITQLGETIRVASKGLAAMTQEVDKLTSIRLTSLYPPDTKRTKNQKKKSVTALISEMAKPDVFSLFDPSILVGHRPFKVVVGEQGQWHVPEIRAQYEARIGAVSRADQQLAEVCRLHLEAYFPVALVA